MSPIACIIYAPFLAPCHWGRFLKETSKFWPQKFHADYVNLECNIFILSTNQSLRLESD